MSGDCRVLLIGMMGSGKSTIGRLLSEATGWPYHDNDELVERAHGISSRALLAERGRDVMRRAESDALSLGLDLPPPAIIGVAGGVIVDEDDRRALTSGGIVVWLRTAAVVLAERAKGADHRPFLEGDAVEWMADALAEREPLYGSVADVVLQTDAESAESAVSRLTAWLAARDACRPYLV